MPHELFSLCLETVFETRAQVENIAPGKNIFYQNTATPSYLPAKESGSLLEGDDAFKLSFKI